MTELLINESPLLVLPSLVNHFKGDYTKAIIMQQLHWLLGLPNSGMDHEGEHWVWKSYEEWCDETFVWMKPKGLQKSILALEKSGHVISTSRVKDSWDSTKYYRINYDSLPGGATGVTLGGPPDITPSEPPEVTPGLPSYTKNTTKKTSKTTDDDVLPSVQIQGLFESYKIPVMMTAKSSAACDSMISMYPWDEIVRGVGKIKEQIDEGSIIREPVSYLVAVMNTKAKTTTRRGGKAEHNPSDYAGINQVDTRLREYAA